MSDHFRLRVVAPLALLAVVFSSAGGAAPSAAPDDPLTRAARIRQDLHSARAAAPPRPAPILRTGVARKRLDLAPGDLLSVSVKKSRALQLTESGTKVVFGRMKGADVVPRGVEYDAGRGLLAVAAVSQVVLYEAATGDVIQILPDSGAFDFANDVLFLEEGLLIADMGAVSGAQLPADGVVWHYEFETGEVTALDANKDLSDPKLLARDGKGRIFLLDGEAGAQIAPPFEPRWDVLYTIEGNRLNRFKTVWNDPGLQATAYDIGRGDWHWIVNLGELVRLKGKKFQRPCLPPYPLAFATGLAIDEDDTAYAMDGADVLGNQRSLWTIDDECVAELVNDRKLKGGRGLTLVPQE